MKCDSCKCDTYTVYVNEKHEKVCGKCFYGIKKHTERVCEKDRAAD